MEASEFIAWMLLIVFFWVVHFTMGYLTERIFGVVPGEDDTDE